MNQTDSRLRAEWIHAAMKQMARPGVYDVAILLLVASSAFGFWTAYDLNAFVSSFALLVAGAILAFVASHLRSWRSLDFACKLFALTAVALCLRFLLFNDWAAVEWRERGDKLPALGAWFALLRAWMPAQMQVVIEPDTAGGIAAIAMPFALHFLLQHRSQRTAQLVWCLSLVVLAVTLVTSLSYGAWIAVILGFAAWAGWLASRRAFRARGVAPAAIWRMQLAALAIAAGVGVLGYIALIFWPPLQDAPGIGAFSRRAASWLSALPLARDYFWSGLGLGNFPAQYPVYALLTQFIVVPRARNIWVDVQIQQGVLGLLGFAGLCAIAVWMGLRALRDVETRDSHLLPACLASLLVLIVNGTLNDPLYGSAPGGLGQVLAFLPPAFVISASCIMAAPAKEKNRRGAWWPAVMSLVVLVCVMGITLALRPTRATIFANLGAVVQSRAELRVFKPEHFDRPTLDQVRQQIDLRAAQALYQRALDLDPANLTVNVRMAQIALARGHYDEALTYALAAWNGGHRDALVRMTLSDAYAATGRLAEAAELVLGIEQAKPRLVAQGWYRYWQAEDYQRTLFAYRVALLLTPDDAALKRSIAEVEQQFMQKGK